MIFSHFIHPILIALNNAAKKPIQKIVYVAQFVGVIDAQIIAINIGEVISMITLQAPSIANKDFANLFIVPPQRISL